MVGVMVPPLVMVAVLGPLTCFQEVDERVTPCTVALPVSLALLVGRVMDTSEPALTVNTVVTGAGLTFKVIWSEVVPPEVLVMVTWNT